MGGCRSVDNRIQDFETRQTVSVAMNIKQSLIE